MGFQGTFWAVASKSTFTARWSLRPLIVLVTLREPLNHSSGDALHPFPRLLADVMRASSVVVISPPRWTHHGSPQWAHCLTAMMKSRWAHSAPPRWTTVYFYRGEPWWGAVDRGGASWAHRVRARWNAVGRGERGGTRWGTVGSPRWGVVDLSGPR